MVVGYHDRCRELASDLGQHAQVPRCRNEASEPKHVQDKIEHLKEASLDLLPQIR